MHSRLITLLKNGGLFLLVLALTGYMILRDYGVKEIATAVKTVDVSWLALGILAMCVFLLCEGINITRALQFFAGAERKVSAKSAAQPVQEKPSLRSGIKYALIGFFFSSITPSASGGQPMQLYYMHRDGVQISYGSLALLFELLSFQTVTIGLAITGYCFQARVMAGTLGNLQYLFLIGILANGIVLSILVCTVFSEKIVNRLTDFAVKLIGVFNAQKAEIVGEKLSEQIREYRCAAVHLKENKAMFMKTLTTTLIQISAMYAIPFLVYRSFGFCEVTALEIMARQAVLYVAVSALPLPGALGVSESGFMVLFQTLFPAAVLPSAMMLSRGLSFYLFVAVSGMTAAVVSLQKKGQRGVLQGTY